MILFRIVNRINRNIVDRILLLKWKVGECMKRVIKIEVTYDLDNSWLEGGVQITPKERVKSMVTEEMVEVFGEDEGYRGVDVEIIDTP